MITYRHTNSGAGGCILINWCSSLLTSLEINLKEMAKYYRGSTTTTISIKLSHNIQTHFDFALRGRGARGA